MRYGLLLSIFLVSALQSVGQVGSQFPSVSGETLDERTLSIPSDTKGKMTIVGLAYAKKAEETLTSWYTPFYDKFVLKRGVFDHKYDVNLYFIPMYSGIKKAAYSANLKELRESSRKDLFPHLIFYKGEVDSYIKALKMDDKDKPYFFVLDQNGTIRYATSGLYNESKMEKIEDILDETW
jgi:hypothetical protein